MLIAPLLQLAKEDHGTLHLPSRNVVVAYTRMLFGKLVKLVVVGGEKGFGVVCRMIVQILHNSPRNGDSVESARTTPQLVKKH